MGRANPEILDTMTRWSLAQLRKVAGHDTFKGMSSAESSAVTRRSFLDAAVRIGTAAATAGFGLPPTLFAQVEPSSQRLIVHSSRPEDLETPAHLLTSWLTPNDLFYVRSHFYTPAVEESRWTLRVDGEVERPIEMTLNELKEMPSTTRVVTLECAGNGRALFQPPVAGVQWRKGAVGTARWTGVRLGDLLRKAGLKSSARHIWLDGADRSVGKAPDFIRDVPIEKATDRDTLLAYQMNGQFLSPAHGFPLRAIVPGWEGAYSVKWLTHIRVADREHEGAFVQSGYRYPKRPVPPGTTVPPADTVPIKNLVIKSIIVSPAADAVVQPGTIRVGGFAWAGEIDVRHVDISTDHGRTWARARLGPERARYAWRRFDYPWRAMEPGAHLVFSRATDTQGRVQPIIAEWNPAGYLWNAIDQVRLNVQP